MGNMGNLNTYTTRSVHKKIIFYSIRPDVSGIVNWVNSLLTILERFELLMGLFSNILLYQSIYMFVDITRIEQTNINRFLGYLRTRTRRPSKLLGRGRHFINILVIDLILMFVKKAHQSIAHFMSKDKDVLTKHADELVSRLCDV